MLTGDMYAPGKIRLIDVPEPMLEPVPPEGCNGQIIFQPETTCLCGSDLPYFNGWDEWPIEHGHSLHEMIGTITATNGNKWRVGDRVLAVPLMQQGLSERFILDEDRAILETLHGFKRAGAAGVLTYFAPQAARLLGA